MKERGVLLLAFSILVIGFLASSFSSTGFASRYDRESQNVRDIQPIPSGYYHIKCDTNSDNDIDYTDENAFASWVTNRYDEDPQLQYVGGPTAERMFDAVPKHVIKNLYNDFGGMQYHEKIAAAKELFNRYC